jgi:serine/threonine protein kinase
MALAPGSRLGPYEILALLGAGGMGEVYAARDGRLDRDVAIKSWRRPSHPMRRRSAGSSAKPRQSPRFHTRPSSPFTNSPPRTAPHMS